MQYKSSKIASAHILHAIWVFAVSFGIGYTVPVLGANALDTLETPSLTRLRIQHQQDTVEVFRKPDGRWWVADRGLPAIQSQVIQTVRQLEALQEREPRVLETEADLRAEGLQLEAALFVRLSFTEGRTQWLRLGEAARHAGTVTWARDAGNPLSANIASPKLAYRTTGILISADIDTWTIPVLLPPFPPQSIDTLRVSWQGTSGGRIRYVLARSGDSVLVQDSSLRKANPHKAYETMGQATSLLVDAFMEPGEASPRVSDEPRVSLRIVLRDGIVYNVMAVAWDSRYDYVSHPDAPDVLVKLRRARLDAFTHTSDYLATSYPFGPDLDDGISGPPPPGVGVYAPHGSHDEPLHHPEHSECAVSDHDKECSH